MEGILILLGTVASLILFNLFYDWFNKKVEIVFYNQEAKRKYEQKKEERYQEDYKWFINEEDYYKHYDKNYQIDYTPSSVVVPIRELPKKDGILSEEDYYAYYEKNAKWSIEEIYSEKTKVMSMQSDIPKVNKKEVNQKVIKREQTHPLFEQWNQMWIDYKEHLTREERYILQEQLPNDLKNLIIGYENLNERLKEKHKNRYEKTLQTLENRGEEIKENITDRIEKQFLFEVRKVEVKQ